MDYGIPPDSANQIKAVLARFPQVESAILYGSRAKGNFKPGSDIDLSLQGNIDLPTLFQITHLLDELPVPFFIDVTLLDEISNADLSDHIRRRGVVFYRKSGS
jgi:predicted nucleotidyltransferase